MTVAPHIPGAGARREQHGATFVIPHLPSFAMDSTPGFVERKDEFGFPFTDAASSTQLT